MFSLTKSHHGMMAIEIYPATKEEMSFLRTAVLDNWMDSPFYKAKRIASPFLQGFDERTNWILIEFWTDNHEEVLEYIKFLNYEFNNPKNNWMKKENRWNHD